MASFHLGKGMGFLAHQGFGVVVLANCLIFEKRSKQNSLNERLQFLDPKQKTCSKT